MRLLNCAVIMSLCVIPIVCAIIESDTTNRTSSRLQVPDIGESSISGGNSTSISANVNGLSRSGREGFGGGGHNKKGGGKMKKKKDGLMSKILPFMVIPFMISSAMTPMALTALKFMLLKSAFIGKMAIILLLVNMFLRFNNQGGVYSHNINLSPAEKEMSMAHYGYNGDEEYGAYVNRRNSR